MKSQASRHNSNFPLVSSHVRQGSAVLAFAMLALLSACSNQEANNAQAAQGAPQAVPVHVASINAQTMPVTIDTVGQTLGSKEVEVRARVGGILLKRLYSEGDSVKAGAPLFQIDPVPYQNALAQAKAQLAQLKAKSDQTAREEARLKPLADERAISQKEYDDALSSLQSARAAQQGAEAQVRDAELNLSYTKVVAPVSGVTGQINRSEGSLITTTDSLLTTLKQVNPIWVNFSLSDSDVASLPGGRFQAEGVAVSLVQQNGEAYPIKGRVNFTASNLDTRLGTQQLRAEFDNPTQKLLPGQFVKVRLTIIRKDPVFSVPQAAVVQTEKGFFVFVVDKDGKAAIRPIKPGSWSGSDWVVLEGLASGDQVITDNLIKIRPGVPVQPQSNEPDKAKDAAVPAKAEKVSQRATRVMG
ncbi:efflux RND transporter periplasmic adaptor subunit [Ampullimonas aquatilis]|uniref:efflux RND transporter periplasmic adaptor subunit n=1 Tax=Ampullimonas aquatilis TaxID=1341549 RepID=UPI003C77AE3A